jgi:CheY-like chemotaxis protein
MPIDVLWVEDEKSTLRYEQTYALANGWNIKTVDTVEAAQNEIQNKEYPLILMDLILPRNNYFLKRGEVDADIGIELLQWIRDPFRKGKTRPDVLVFIISAVLSQDRIGKVMEILNNRGYYLNKPLTVGGFEKTFIEIMDILGI